MLYVSFQLEEQEEEEVRWKKFHQMAKRRETLSCLLRKSELARGDSLIIDGMNAEDEVNERKFLIEQMTNNLSIIKRTEAT